MSAQMRSRMRKELDAQLRRQSLWLRDSLLWILNSKVLANSRLAESPTALDVGCGPGFTMELLRALMRVEGVDNDLEMVRAASSKGLKVAQADGEDLPFQDSSFDIVYCSFLLLWVNDPEKVLGEMKRVSKDWVIAFAEPDYGARLDYPPELSGLKDIVISGMKSEGGDPLIGRKLRYMFSRAGLDVEIGVHMGIWDLERLRAESEDEMRWLEMTVASAGKEQLHGLRPVWDRALKEGSLFQFNPIFYAIGRKKH